MVKTPALDRHCRTNKLKTSARPTIVVLCLHRTASFVVLRCAVLRCRLVPFSLPAFLLPRGLE